MNAVNDTNRIENINILKSMLYNTIICWYDDILEEYDLTEEDFINRVCEKIGLKKEEYEDLMKFMEEN